MTQNEALRLAWEALSYINEGANNQGAHTGISWRCAANKSAEALNAIKAALEAKDEPVAWVYPEFWQHLENLNCGTAYRLTGIGRQPLYTTPPQRKPLSDEEILTYRYMIDWTAEWSYINFARAIEAAHGIKENT